MAGVLTPPEYRVLPGVMLPDPRCLSGGLAKSVEGAGESNVVVEVDASEVGVSMLDALDDA